VIRMVDGQMTTYDTTLAANTTFTPNDYLAHLGFENDEQISIIDFTKGHENAFTFSSYGEDGHQGEMIFIEMDEDYHTSGDEDHEVIIEKRIIHSSDVGDEDVTIDIEALLKGINIDSLVAVAMEGLEADSNQVIIKKMIMSDEHHTGGEGMTWESIDATDADFHKEMSGTNHHMEVAVWGDEEDFTMVIVSDSSTNPSNKGMVAIEDNKEEAMFKLFPNPATTSSQLDLNFSEKAPTIINITDMRGRTVANMDLGDFAGPFKHTIDVTKWQKGVYVIQVDHGTEKIMEKLIIE
jgi:hypothetical protein